MTAEGVDNARRRLHMRKGDFASAIGVCLRTANAYETGRNPIPLYIALAIGALLYGLPPAE